MTLRAIFEVIINDLFLICSLRKLNIHLNEGYNHNLSGSLTVINCIKGHHRVTTDIDTRYQMSMPFFISIRLQFGVFRFSCELNNHLIVRSVCHLQPMQSVLEDKHAWHVGLVHCKKITGSLCVCFHMRSSQGLKYSRSFMVDDAIRQKFCF